MQSAWCNTCWSDATVMFVLAVQTCAANVWCCTNWQTCRSCMRVNNVLISRLSDPSSCDILGPPVHPRPTWQTCRSCMRVNNVLISRLSDPSSCDILGPPVHPRPTSAGSPLGDTIFSILSQVQQRADVHIPDSWQRVQQGRKWTPASFLRFQMMGWRNPHEQHDIVEFLHFLLPRLGWVGEPFSWGARLLVEGAQEERIHSGAVHVLMLNPSDGLCDSDVQNAINSWHAQPAIHGLHSAPRAQVCAVASSI